MQLLEVGQSRMMIVELRHNTSLELSCHRRSLLVLNPVTGPNNRIPSLFNPGNKGISLILSMLAKDQDQAVHSQTVLSPG